MAKSKLDVDIPTAEPEDANVEFVEVNPKESAAVMNLDSFITIKKHPISILHRLEIFLGDGKEAERTEAEWDIVYSQAMNRITA